MMSYTAKKNITINSSIPYDPNSTKNWRTLVTTNFNAPYEIDNVLFLEQTNETLDSGPDVLSRFSCNFAKQIETATKSLGNLLKQGSKPPVQLKFKTESGYSPCEFEYNGFGTVIIELSISKKDYIPMIKEAWASFSISNLEQKYNLKNEARRTILNTLKECGAEIDERFKLNLEFQFSADPADLYSPMKAIARGLTMSAFSNALCQAAGTEASILPTSATRIQEILNGGK